MPDIKKPIIKIVTTNPIAPLQRADPTKPRNPQPRSSAAPQFKPPTPTQKIRIPKETLPHQDLLNEEQALIESVLEEGKQKELTPTQDYIENSEESAGDLSFLSSKSDIKIALPLIRPQTPIPQPPVNKTRDKPLTKEYGVKDMESELQNILQTPKQHRPQISDIITLPLNNTVVVEYRANYMDSPKISEVPINSNILRVPREDPIFDAVILEHAMESETRDISICLESPFKFMSRGKFAQLFKEHFKHKTLDLSYACPQYKIDDDLHQIYFSSGTCVISDYAYFIVLDVKIIVKNLQKITNILTRTDSLSRVQVSEILLGSINLLFT